MRVDMEKRAIKEVVLIIQQLFGLDIWPLACKERNLFLSYIKPRARVASKSNAFGVAPAKILEMALKSCYKKFILDSENFEFV